MRGVLRADLKKSNSRKGLVLMTKKMFFFDTHCHLDMCKEALECLVNKAKQKNVVKFVIPGVCGLPNNAEKLVGRGEIGICFGFHPMHAENMPENLGSVLGNVPICAIGECGLDKRVNISIGEQERAFKLQLNLAAKNELPAIIHLVGCFQRAYEIIASMPKRPICVFHSYSGSPEMALRFVKLGAYISVSASALKNQARLKALAEAVLPNRLLLETDSPSQKPLFCAEDENSPAHLPQIAFEIARILKTNIEKTAEIIYNNSVRVFNKSRLIKL